MTLKPGEVIWVRGTVAQVTPNALLVTFTGPGGAPIPFPIHPDSPLMLDDPPTPSAT